YMCFYCLHVLLLTLRPPLTCIAMYRSVSPLFIYKSRFRMTKRCRGRLHEIRKNLISKPLTLALNLGRALWSQ
ncbi:hypothetical protein BC941DRAFT_434659, partial [Chlamydoabsidia padenii]